MSPAFAQTPDNVGMTNPLALLLVIGTTLAGAGFALLLDSLFGGVQLSEDAAPLFSGIVMGVGTGVAIVAGLCRRPAPSHPSPQ